MKLPLERIPYSGSTDSYIKDADGNSIVRCSCGYCKCGEQMSGNEAFPDKAAKLIVAAVNVMSAVRRWQKASDAVDDYNAPSPHQLDGYNLHQELDQSHGAVMDLLSELDLDLLDVEPQADTDTCTCAIIDFGCPTHKQDDV